MDDWERQQNEDLFRQQASDYMDRHTWYMKEQEARQMAESRGGGGGGDAIDALFGLGVVLFILGFLVYAAWTAIFGG
jgi:hypothetical protein